MKADTNSQSDPSAPHHDMNDLSQHHTDSSARRLFLVHFQSQILQSFTRRNQDSLTTQSPAPSKTPAPACSAPPDLPAGIDPVTLGEKTNERRGASTRSLPPLSKPRLFLSHTPGSAAAPGARMTKRLSQSPDPERNGFFGGKATASGTGSSRLPKLKNH